MVKAYPINNKGVKEGATVTFTNEKWERMVKIFGKKLHWRKTDKDDTEVKEIELIRKELVGDHIPVSTKKTRKKKTNE